MIVAPNSPSARAQQSTAPAAIPGATSGSVTRRNVVQRSAPSVAAASSKRASAARSAPSTLITRNGMATNVSAMTTAAVVNGIVTSNCSNSQRADDALPAEHEEQRDAADHRAAAPAAR